MIMRNNEQINLPVIEVIIIDSFLIYVDDESSLILM